MENYLNTKIHKYLHKFMTNKDLNLYISQVEEAEKKIVDKNLQRHNFAINVKVIGKFKSSM
jgi:hypothetical protein